MTTVASVYVPGVHFGRQQVYKLRDAVARYCHTDYRFVCLTNEKLDGVETIPLVNKWPGWYSKLELFRAGALSGQVVYLDLDTVLVGDVTNIFTRPYEFAALAAWKGGKPVDVLGSGMMAWDADKDLSVIPGSFKLADCLHYESDWKCWGDQGVIQKYLPCKWECLQTLWPDRIIGFKQQVWGGTKNINAHPPREASIVYFSGNPRPWNLPADSPLGRAWRGP